MLTFLVFIKTILINAVVASQLHSLSNEFIAWINENQSYWKAGRNFLMSDWERLRPIASGVWLEDTPIEQSEDNEDTYYTPNHFDAREAWPHCESIRQIWDQSQCGSCWAVSAAAAMSDRICIHSGQTLQVYVSAEDLMSCCNQCGQQCAGGSPWQAWKYWQDYGIVTGGLYNSSKGCKPYSLPPCEHHINVPFKLSCLQLTSPALQCHRHCHDPSLSYATSLTFGGNVKRFFKEDAIRAEIMINGPVEAVLEVYEDFYNYKSGIYSRTGGKHIGKHAVKILGWGDEEGVPYWLCSNSWNSDWGDKGYFKIVRWGNHCGIRNQVFASLPNIIN